MKKADLEYVLEVAAAGGEDDPVGLDGAALAGQRHVHEVLVQLQVAEGHHDVRLVVVPFQTELIRSHPKERKCVRVGFCDLKTVVDSGVPLSEQSCVCVGDYRLRPESMRESLGSPSPPGGPACLCFDPCPLSHLRGLPREPGITLGSTIVHLLPHFLILAPQKNALVWNWIDHKIV